MTLSRAQVSSLLSANPRQRGGLRFRYDVRTSAADRAWLATVTLLTTLAVVIALVGF